MYFHLKVTIYLSFLTSTTQGCQSSEQQVVVPPAEQYNTFVLTIHELPKWRHAHLTSYNTAKTPLIKTNKQKQCLPLMAFSGDSSTTPVSQPGSEDLEKQQTFWTWYTVHIYENKTLHKD